MTYDPLKHHRRSNRLKGYDDSRPGAYFITLVTHKRESLFGEIENGVMHPSLLGEIVCEEWKRSGLVRREICLNEDEFVMMPNHLHRIIWIIDNPGEREDNSGVKAIHAQLGTPIPAETQPRKPHQADTFKLLPRTLSSFIAGFKASVTSRAARQLGLPAVWQRDYYDHIVRDAGDFQRIWQYIDDNPRRWEEGLLHPDAAPNRFQK